MRSTSIKAHSVTALERAVLAGKC